MFIKKLHKVSLKVSTFVLFTFLLFFSLNAKAFAATYYVDNACAFNGGGTSTACAVSSGKAGAFNSITNMQAKSGGYLPGDTILLKSGETFRETFTLPSSGSTTGYITLDSYASGTKPIIKASNVFASSSWSAYTTGTANTYQAAAPLQVYFVWKDGVFMAKGASQATLNDHEWYWATSTLYFRDSSGSPATTGVLIEGSVRANAIALTSKNYWNINNLELMHTNGVGSGSYAIRIITSADHINMTGLVIDEAAGINIETLGTNITIQNTKFGATRLSSQRALNITGASSTVTVINSIFDNTLVSNAVKINSGSANIYNSLFDSYYTTPILDTSAQPVNISNVIINGSSNAGTDVAINNTGTGVLTLSNSLILPDGRAGTKLLPAWSAKFVNGGGIKYADPQWVNTRNRGVIAFMHDDLGGTNDWINMTKLADEYGIKITDALNTGLLNSTYIPLIQEGINRGHPIVSHSRSHADMSTFNSFTIRYVGTGSSATMNISAASNTLTVDVAGTPADSLNLDLTNIKYSEEVALCQYLTTNYAGRYTCTQGGTTGTYGELVSKEGTLILSEVVGQDIKSAPYTALFDSARYFNNELVLPQSDITANFTNASGTAYIGKTFVYPAGRYSTSSIAQIIADGYTGARSTDSLLSNPPNWQMSGTYTYTPGINIYKVETLGASAGYVAGLDFENNTTDSSGSGNNFTANTLTYSTSSDGVNFSVYSAVLNGTNSYASHAANSSFDFSAGDYTISAWVNAATTSTTQTLYFQGTDANNYHQLYIDSTGALVYSIVASGTESVHIASAANTITAGAWQRVNLKVHSGVYTLYLGDKNNAQTPTVLATLTSSAIPAVYTGTVYIGCGYNYAGSTVNNCYNGKLDYYIIGNHVYSQTTALMATLASNGGFAAMYSHVENVPLPIYRVMFDAVKDFTGRVNVMTFDDAIDYLRANGTAQSDGQTWVYTQPDQSDYHLLPTSPAIGAGVSVVGRTTDFDGNPVVGTPNIGPY